MLTDTELIRKLDFFEPLSPKIIKKIAHLCIVREFSAGDYIVRQGESGLGLYFITGGRAKVEIEREGSKLVVAELKEGDFLGELAIIDDKARSANVICLEETRCLLLTRDSFAKMMTKHPEIAIQMLRTLVGRIRSTNERVTQRVGSAPQAAPSLPAASLPPIPSTPVDGISAAADRITAVIPKPEDLVRMYSSTKDKVRDMLVDVFSSLYVMKAMTRFSVAIVGCPVSVRAEKRYPDVLETTIEGVKLVLFPARNDQIIRIEGLEDGKLSAAVLRPAGGGGSGGAEVFRLEGPVRRKEVLRLQVPAGKQIGWEPCRMDPESCFSPPFAVFRAEDSPRESRRVLTRTNGKGKALLAPRRKRPGNGQPVP